MYLTMTEPSINYNRPQTMPRCQEENQPTNRWPSSREEAGLLLICESWNLKVQTSASFKLQRQHFYHSLPEALGEKTAGSAKLSLNSLQTSQPQLRQGDSNYLYTFFQMHPPIKKKKKKNTLAVFLFLYITFYISLSLPDPWFIPPWPLSSHSTQSPAHEEARFSHFHKFFWDIQGAKVQSSGLGQQSSGPQRERVSWTRLKLPRSCLALDFIIKVTGCLITSSMQSN